MAVPMAQTSDIKSTAPCYAHQSRHERTFATIKGFLRISFLSFILKGLLLLSFVPILISEGWAGNTESDSLYDFLDGQ